MQFNLADLYESLADAIPDRPALVAGDRRLTFAGLEARANRLAHALAARGIGPGDHVGLYLYNGAEYVEAMLAAFKLRAVPVNVNYRYVEDELLYLFANADLAALVHQRELGAHVSAVPHALRVRVAVDDGSDVPLDGALEYERLLADAPEERRFPARSADDLHIIYTGGTTGMPRGVMWRHEDLLFAGLQGGNPGGPPIQRPEDLAPNARARQSPMCILPAAPLIHGAAQLATFISLLSGGRVVLAPGRSFDARAVVRLIGAERVNTAVIVGDAMARPLAEALAEPGADASSLMVLTSGGAILSASVKQELAARLPFTIILNSFGASETGHQGNMLPGPGSAGGFMMDGTSAVLDEENRPVAPGSGVVGRLARRGRLPLGYYKDPEKTAATFVTIGDTRWCIPGDLATVEADGRVHVLGRGNVCINSGGEKIFVEEVEEAIKAIPSVLDAVVVGVPDDRWGQRVAAVVQLRPGAELTLAAVEEHCRKRLAGYKVPRQLRLVEQLQRQPSGKPDYRWARQAAEA
jgi:acyl-CoA synthetase (AMP-forming)/AMP-acid ligase II